MIVKILSTNDGPKKLKPPLSLVVLMALRNNPRSTQCQLAIIIEKKTGYKIGVGPTYNCLKRFHDNEYLTIDYTPPTKKRGGRKEKLYTITELGMKKSNQLTTIIEKLK